MEYQEQKEKWNSSIFEELLSFGKKFGEGCRFKLVNEFPRTIVYKGKYMEDGWDFFNHSKKEILSIFLDYCDTSVRMCCLIVFNGVERASMTWEDTFVCMMCKKHMKKILENSHLRTCIAKNIPCFYVVDEHKKDVNSFSLNEKATLWKSFLESYSRWKNNFKQKQRFVWAKNKNLTIDDLIERFKSEEIKANCSLAEKRLRRGSGVHTDKLWLHFNGEKFHASSKDSGETKILEVDKNSGIKMIAQYVADNPNERLGVLVREDRPFLDKTLESLLMITSITPGNIFAFENVLSATRIISAERGITDARLKLLLGLTDETQRILQVLHEIPKFRIAVERFLIE